MIRRLNSFFLPLNLSIAILIAAIAVPVSGKVFRLFGGTDPEVFLNGTLPWDHAYRTQMTVNGRQATVNMYAARYSEPVVEQLKNRFEEMGAKVQVARSEHGATGRAVWPDRVIGFIVMSPPSEPMHQVFIYEPESGDRSAPARFPVPEYRNGTTRTTISDDDTKTFMAIAETYDSSTDIHSFYSRELQGSGWSLVAPATARNGTIGGMAVYMKGSQVCYVQSTDKPGQPNMVTLLVKGGRL